MHPLKAAIAALHHVSSKLHESMQDFEFTEREQDKIIDVLLGAVPMVVNAAQEVFSATLAYIASR